MRLCYFVCTALVFFAVVSSSAAAATDVNVDANVNPASRDEVTIFNNRGTDYPYPFQDPYFASMTARLLSARKIHPVALRIAPLEGRLTVPLLEKRAGEFKVAVFAQAKPAPVVFIIPGYGGSSGDGQQHFLGEILYSLGHSVIVLYNPSHWKFVLAQTTIPMPGYAPEESKDLYRVMKQAIAAARTELGLVPTSYGMIGYSMGATHAAFVWQLDKKLGEFRFGRVLMLNAPIDMNYSIESLDALYAVADGWSQNRRDAVWGKAMHHADVILARAERGENVFPLLPKLFPLTTTELKFMIGDTFHRSLGDGLFTGQQIMDTGAIKTPATKYRRESRYAEIRTIGFGAYARDIAFPFWKERLGLKEESVAQFVERGSLLRLTGALAADPVVHFMHNRDDFIVRGPQVVTMARALGRRAFLYSRGGHLGNVWMDANVRDIAVVFSGLK